MQSPRFWSPRARLTGVVALFVVVPTAAGVAAVFVNNKSAWVNVVTAAPVMALTVGLLSLVVTAVSAANNWQRAKRAATISHWSQWSAESLVHRRTVTRLIGNLSLTDAQGKALVEERDLPDLERALSDEERQALSEAIRSTLNGLERIAVGVELGVLDLSTLRRLGGTTILRCYQRWEQYVIHRRAAHNREVSFQFAFVELEELVRRLESHDLLTKKRAIDNKRLDALRKR